MSWVRRYGKTACYQCKQKLAPNGTAFKVYVTLGGVKVW